MTAPPKRKQKRVRRPLVIASAVITGTVVAVYVAAEMDMARERAARRYLGDQLYTEIHGTGGPVVFLAGLQGSTRYWGQTWHRERKLWSCRSRPA